MAQADKPWPISVRCAVLEGRRSGFSAYRQRHGNGRSGKVAQESVG